MARYRQIDLSGALQGSLLVPDVPGDWGILVLAGSSGRVDIARASLFANMGATAFAQRWFGGERQPPGICEVPLETFVMGVDALQQRGCRRIAIIGTSKGAEAALLLATLDSRIDSVFAISPTSVVWGNIGSGRDGISWPERSSWTWKNTPISFVPADPDWKREFRDGLVSFRGLFELCLTKSAANVPAATIPIERSRAEIVLVAGGDDALWPSDLFARALVQRGAQMGKDIQLIQDANVGHRVLLPGETTPKSRLHAHGGTDEADARLGQAAWDVFVAALRSSRE